MVIGKLVYLTQDQIKRLRKEAYDTNQNQSEIVRQALEVYFAGKK